jgi:uroporphyrinogen-III synthase
MSEALIVLRPEPGNARTVAAIQKHGRTAVAAPLFTLHSLAWTPPPADDFDALALTSANALRYAGPGLSTYRALPVYAVGKATATAATAAGLSVQHIGTGDGTALASAAAEAGVKRMLHLCGEAHRSLARPGLAVTACPVYAAEPLDALPPPAAAELRRGAIALVHSPRAGALLAGLVDAQGIARATVTLAAISPAAALATGSGWRETAVAERPDDDALLAVALAICDHPG